jgi:hypothetical protein
MHIPPYDGRSGFPGGQKLGLHGRQQCTFASERAGLPSVEQRLAVIGPCLGIGRAPHIECQLAQRPGLPIDLRLERFIEPPQLFFLADDGGEG